MATKTKRRKLTRKQLKYFGTKRQRAAAHVSRPRSVVRHNKTQKKRWSTKKKGSNTLGLVAVGLGGLAVGTGIGTVFGDGIKDTLNNAKDWVAGKLGFSPSQQKAIEQGAQIVTTPSGDKIPIFGPGGKLNTVMSPPIATYNPITGINQYGGVGTLPYGPPAPAADSPAAPIDWDVNAALASVSNVLDPQKALLSAEGLTDQQIAEGYSWYEGNNPESNSVGVGTVDETNQWLWGGN